MPNPPHRCLRATALVALCFAVLAGASLTLAQPRVELVIDRVSVLETSFDRFAPNRSVWIGGGRILAIAAAGTRPGPTVRVVDAGGGYLIPGLWDMHVHLANAGSEAAVAVLLSHGVTGVRDMGSSLEALEAMKRLAPEPTRVYPRIVAAGFMLESPASMDFWRRVRERTILAGGGDPLENLGQIEVADAAAAWDAVETVRRSGADFIKVIDVASPDVFFAVATASARAGLPLVGHPPFWKGVGPADAFRAGLRTVEHTTSYPDLMRGLDATARGALFELMNALGVALVPTLSLHEVADYAPAEQLARWLAADDVNEEPRLAFVDRGVWPRWRNWLNATREGNRPSEDELHRRRAERIAQLREMHAAGVMILPGTDLGAPFIFAGSSLHDELRLFEREVGMTAAEVLRSATQLSAAFNGLEHDVGTIAEGKAADLVLLNADPLRDLGALSAVESVVVGGELLDRSRLDERLRAVRRR